MNYKSVLPKSGDRFLWVRFYALGDALQGVAEAFLIKRRFPEIEMSFLTRPLYKDIIASQPYLDKVICGEKKPLSVLMNTASAVKSAGTDWICSTYQGAHMPLLAKMAGVRNRLGNSRYFGFMETHNIYSWCDSLGIDLFDRNEPCLFASESALACAERLLANLPEKKIFVAIGASFPDKRWPVDNWIDFLSPLAADGWGIVLVGHGAEEESIASQIKNKIQSDYILDLTSKLNFVNMSGVANLCTVAVGNDTGPMHITALSGVPSMVISDYVLPPEIGYLMPWLLPVTVFGQHDGKTLYKSQRSAETLRKITGARALDEFVKLLAIDAPIRPSFVK